MTFPYKTDPLPHQKEVVESTAFLEDYALFWEMGLGKSKAIIDTCSALHNAGKINGAILISDKGNYRNWLSELKTHSAINYRHFIYASGKQCKLPDPSGTMDYLLVNVEALSSSKNVMDWIHKFCRERTVLCCIDEATSIKGQDSLRSRNAYYMRNLFAYRRILTGTPLCQSPLDIFGQFRFLKPEVFGTAFYPFRSTYAELQEIQLPGRKSFKTVTGYRNQAQFARLLKPYCSRLTKADCLNLPPKIYMRREVEHTKEQAKIYKELVDFAVAELAGGRIATSASALSLVNRFRQLNLGRITSDDQVFQAVPHKRLEALGRILEEHDGKAIIWCAFQKDVEEVKAFLGDKAVTYYGPMASGARNDALESIIKRDDIKYFIATPDTAGKSLTLVVANLCVYYSNGFRLEHRLQSEDRAHRHGQTRSVTYVDLVCPGTIDEEILDNLQGKKDQAENILETLKRTVAFRPSEEPRSSSDAT